MVVQFERIRGQCVLLALSDPILEDGLFWLWLLDLHYIKQ